ncbi:MAG: hypothetical protein VKM34_03800 [Cyanobacteriota bacterium]|nr:hypothetical protein [Cyanobacteriota bacterium]
MIQAQKYARRTEQLAVLKTFAEGELLRRLPFRNLVGGSLSFPAETKLPRVGFRAVNESYRQSYGVINSDSEFDGSTRVRSLTIYSRNLKDGQTHSLNCRQKGERITKQFLLRGISRLELPGLVPPLVLSTPREISSWLERHIPERSSAPPPSRKPPAASEPPAAVTERREVPAAPQGEALPPPPPPPLPPQHQRPPVARLPDLLPDGARGFAVLDLETTGIGRSCRIVEVAHFADVDGIDLSLGSGVDTMPTPRVKLVELCARHGVVLDQAVAHTALGDTRALARALRNGMAHLKPATSAVTVRHNGLLERPARTLTRAMAAAAQPSSDWTTVTIELEPGQLFITTGPASMRTDTEIKRAEAYGIRLGVEYRKVNGIPKRNPPAFVLSTSLTLATRKMTEARELQRPVVLCSDFLQARIGSTVRAWRHQN